MSLPPLPAGTHRAVPCFLLPALPSSLPQRAPAANPGPLCCHSPSAAAATVVAAMAFRFGILTDVQYADKPAVPHPRFRAATAAAAAAAAASGLPPPSPLALRDYRDALPRLHAAMDDLLTNDGSGSERTPLGAVLHLGDLIDGRVLAHDDGALAADAAGRPPPRASAMAANQVDLGAVLAAFRRFTAGPVLHVMGNHCLFAGREAVLAAAGVPKGNHLGDAWYTFVPPSVGGKGTKGVGIGGDGGGGGGGGRPWRIVVLDTMAIGVAYPPGDARRDAACAHLAAAAGAPNAVEWVGALGPAQRGWLAGVCAAARAAGEQLLVCGHHPLDAAVAVCFLRAGGGGSQVGGARVKGKMKEEMGGSTGGCTIDQCG